MNSRLTELFYKYIEGTFTAAERLEFLNILNEGNYEQDLKQMMDTEIRKLPAAYSLDDAGVERVLQRILNASPAENKGNENNIPPAVYRSNWRKAPWLRVAAVLLLIAGTAGYFFYKHPTRLSETIVSKIKDQTDRLPGGNRAILMLADGTRIVLDSAANGNLTRQGSTTIIKLNNGALAYEGGAASGELLYNTITTPKGGQYQITLSDGTRVWLNAASSIRFPTAFSDDRRMVSVTGEVYVEVAKNKNKPFFVEVKDISVEVLGTEFNINAYEDQNEIYTTLLQGSVQVIKGAKTIALKPGQQARSASGNDMLKLVPDPDIQQVIAWKNGIFNFNHRSLKEVMLQLSRWYDVEVQYKGDIPPVVFYGEMRRDLTLNQVLELLEVFDVKFQLKDGKQLIVSKG